LEIHNYEITEYNPETAEELSNNKHQGRVEL